jgi:hypothetical protein
LALASINTSGTWRPCLLSYHTCSPPLRAPRCEAIQCPDHTTAGRTAPAGTRINLVSLVASTGPSRGRSQRSLLLSVGTTFRTDTCQAPLVTLMPPPLRSFSTQEGGLHVPRTKRPHHSTPNRRVDDDCGEPLRPQGFRRTLYNLIHSRITSQGWHNLTLTQL